MRSIRAYQDRPLLRRQSATLIACLSILLAGCSTRPTTNYSDLNLKEIDGTVKLDGTPVAGAAVLFEAEDKTWSYATTDTSGYYRLQYNSEQTGVLNGPKVVRIGTTLSTGESEATDDPDGGADEGEESDEGSSGERIPSCYNRESVLRVTVDASTTMNFNLKSDCSTTGPAG